MIRTATLGDMPFLLDCARKFHGASGWKCEFNPAASEQTITSLIRGDEATIIRSPSGMIGGQIAPFYASPDWRAAVELFWWAEGGSGRALLAAFEMWAKDMNADEIRMTSLASLPRADGLLKRLGYAPAEISYTKAV